MSQEETGTTTKYLRDKKNIYVISVMKEKNIILTARIMSMIFTPFYLPMVGLIALFIFSYMSLLPIGYKLVMLGMVYLLTVVAPSLLIHLYRMVQGWTSRELGKKERRIVPYILSIVCYFGCFSGWNTAIRLASSVSS